MNDLLSTIIALAIVFPFAIWFAKVAERAEGKKINTKGQQKSKKNQKVENTSIGWLLKTIVFLVFALIYIYCYGMQGFMCFSPTLWPLPLFLITSLIIFNIGGKMQWILVVAMSVLAISIDSGVYSLPASDGDHYTMVESFILIPFWLISILMNNASLSDQ